jgi:hypothetical protein
MFLNCNDLPPGRFSIGDSILRVKFPNKCIENSELPNEKQSDPDLEDSLQLPAFADGMLWFILDEYMGFLNSGQNFKPIPEVKSKTEEANETEGEDLIDTLINSLEFAPPFSTLESCRDSGFLIRPNYIKEVGSGLKREQKLLGVSNSVAITQLGHRGYPKIKIRYSRDDKQPLNPVSWIGGVKPKTHGSDDGDEA